MTLLRDIQNEATEATVPVSTVLRRAQTLAFRLNHEPLKQWTRNELEGYQSIDELPDYRRFPVGALPVKAEVMDITGIYRNVPIAPMQVPEYTREHLFTPAFMQGVAEYEALLATGVHEFPIPWTGDQVLFIRKTVLPGLAGAAQMVSSNTIAGILDQVRNRILSFSLEIEQQNPDAGEARPGEEPIAEKTVTNIFNNTIHGGHNVITAAGRDAHVVAPHTRIDEAWPALQQRLAEFGVPPEEVEGLEAALRLDGDPSTELGPATQSWIGRLTSKVSSGGIALAQGVSVEMVVHELLKVLGLG